MTLTPSTRLGHYEITSLLGSGGMGEVYRAKDHKLGRDVAIKVLREELASDPERLRRFEQEARSASALNHPNIITIYDIRLRQGYGGQVGKTEDIDFIVMELVEGETLRKMLSEGPLPTKKLLQLATQIAEGLAKAHSAGIIHRDLKPENLMVTSDGYVKILDFGLAKLRTALPDTDSEVATMTKEGTAQGTVMGTVGYMSPEQAKGQSADYRSDQFSLGAILYEMVTGKRAFQRDSSVQTLSAIIEQEPVSIAALHPETPAQLRVIVERCLAKNPEERYDSTRDLARELKSIAEVATPLPSESIAAPLNRRRTWPRIVAIAGGLAAVFALAFVLNLGGLRGRLTGKPNAPRIDSIAVLPLENLSGDPEQEYFSDGMTEALTAELGQLGGVRVISRTSVMMYKDARKSLSEIARELNVDAVVEGSVLRSKDRVRITAQLVRVKPEEHLWGHSYERDYGEVLALQSKIALAIAREIQGTLSPQTESRLTGAREVDRDAYEAYLKGRYYINQRTTEGFERSREYFQQAIDEDPTYAPAYTGLAEYYVMVSFYSGLSPKEQAPLARAAVEKAMQLDDRFAEAHHTLGVVHYVYDWKWSEAEREFKRAIELKPNYAPAHMSYSSYIASVTGHVEDAAREIDRALEIDPLSPLTSAGGGFYLFSAREFDRALYYVDMALELDPVYPMARWVRGLIYMQKGLLQEAVTELEEALRGGLGTNSLADLGLVYALMGRTDDALEILKELMNPPGQTYASPYHIALVYTGLGDLNEALQWMEKAYEDRSSSMIYSRADPRLDPLRSDPRFQDLLRRMNFPE